MLLKLADNIDELKVFLTAMRLRYSMTDDAERLRILNRVEQSRTLVLYCCETESQSAPRYRLLKTIAKHPAVTGESVTQLSAEEIESLGDFSRKIRKAFRRKKLKS
jgi:hypothetical protein